MYLDEIKGETSILNLETATFEPVATPQPIPMGTLLQTGPDGSVVVRVAPKTLLRVGAATTLQVQDKGVYLIVGTIDAELDAGDTFIVHTVFLSVGSNDASHFAVRSEATAAYRTVEVEVASPAVYVARVNAPTERLAIAKGESICLVRRHAPKAP